jgi:hypothetical protein
MFLPIEYPSRCRTRDQGPHRPPSCRSRAVVHPHPIPCRVHGSCGPVRIFVSGSQGTLFAA